MLGKLQRVRLRTGSATVIASLAAGSVLLWFLLFLAMGDGRRLGYANAFGFWWGILVLIAAGILAWRRALVRALAGLVLGFLVLSYGVAVPRVQVERSEMGDHFRLVTASLRNYNNDMDAAAVLLFRDRPDILVVQEADVGAFVAALQRVSGQVWNSAKRNNEIILCRCVISDVRTEGYILSAGLTLHGVPVRVWNVRAPKSYSNVVQNRLYFSGLANQMLGVGRGIAAGDFNATPWNEGYRMIRQVAQDSWRSVGWGPGFTFPTRARRMGLIAPLIRIDHVFSTGDIVATTARVGRASAGADHLPVIVDFSKRS